MLIASFSNETLHVAATFNSCGCKDISLTVILYENQIRFSLEFCVWWIFCFYLLTTLDDVHAYLGEKKENPAIAGGVTTLK
jgi:hypothetical protein